MEKEKKDSNATNTIQPNLHQIPSLERFKDLLFKLETEYKLLWAENQELKSIIENNNNNNNNNNNSNSQNINTNENIASTTVLKPEPIVIPLKPEPIITPLSTIVVQPTQPIQQPQPTLNNINYNNNSTNNLLVSSTSSGSKNNKLTTKLKKSKSHSSSSSSSSKSTSQRDQSISGKNSNSNSNGNLSKRDGSHKWIRAKEYIGHRDGIWEVTACPWDLLYFGTACTDKTARIWSVDGSKLPIIYTAHTGTVNSIRFHPNERYFCTASGDKTVHIIKLPAERSSTNNGFIPKSPISFSQQQQTINSGNITQLSSSPSQFNHQVTSHSPVMGRSSNIITGSTTTGIQVNSNRNKLWTPLLDRQQPITTTTATTNTIGSNVGNQMPSNFNTQLQQQQTIPQGDFDMDYDLDSDTDSDYAEQIQQQQQHQHNQSNSPPPSNFRMQPILQQQQQPIQSFVPNIIPPQPPQSPRDQHKTISLPQQQSTIPVSIPSSSASQQQSQPNNIVQSINEQPQPTNTYLRAPMLELKGHSQPVIGATWISSSVVVSSSWDNSIRWWNTDNGKLISSSSICNVSSSNQDKIHRVTNVTSNPQIGNTNAVTSSTDGIIRIWDYRSSLAGGCIDSIAGYQEPVNSAVLSSDGYHIVAGGEDRVVKVWDVRQSKTYKTSIRCPFGINRLSVSPNTACIAIPQDDGRISVYDIYGNRKGKMRDQYKYGHKQMASATSWSYDDSVIFSAGFDRKAICWASSS